MTIQEHISLASYTTFNVGGPARFFCVVKNEAELIEAVTFARERDLGIFVLGGGSNILMSDEGFGGLVIKIEIMGIREEIHEGTGTQLIRVSAGEQWDSFVAYAVDRGLYGLENLSAIPGTVGAAPVQNIGAYGTEVSHTIVSVRALDMRTTQFVELDNASCQFAYRDSLFKKEKGRYIITGVVFGLHADGSVNTDYKDVADYMAAKNITAPTLTQVREAIIDIRWNKLPDWKLWGTAGSFFKNPVVAADVFEKLAARYPGLPGFPESDGRVKISLGWVLDKICNVRGLCKGNACVYEKQALVLVTKPGATAHEVVDLAHELMRRVKEKTGVTIEGEVEWVN